MLKRIINIFSLTFIGFTSINAQMRQPTEWLGYENVFGVKEGLRQYDFNVIPIASSAPANIFWPKDSVRFKFQITNNTSEAIEKDAHIYIVRYGIKGIPNNVWLPNMIKLDYDKVIPAHISISAKSYTDISISVDNINQYGGYAVIFDLGNYGRRLATSFVYSMKPSPVKMQYPKQSLDDLGVDFLSRIGVQSIRQGTSYMSADNTNYQSYMQNFDKQMKAYKDNNITVMLMFGEGGTVMPLGVSRPHLDDKGIFLRTKQDYVWLPSKDDDFKQFVKNICLKYGWPKGPVTAISLWNEPWEGISISGWQSDMVRYREIYKKMAEAVLEARKQGTDVLVGGCDSNSNAWDKFFGDGTMDMLPVFDFLSIHYQGMESPVLYPEWNNRKDYKGRVRIWDTESWVGNTDDRIGLVVATNRSAGYDRSMGIYGGYMYSGKGDNDPTNITTIQTNHGLKQIQSVHSSWSPAAAMAATQALIGERDFNELLFKKGLPWVMLFDGYNQDKEDGTIVIAGDLGEAFGAENILFRNVRGLTEIKRKIELRKKLEILPAGSNERKTIEYELNSYFPISDGKMIVKADSSFLLYDFYGNTISPQNNRYEIPLNYQGYFMRVSGIRGSFDRLVAAIRDSRIEGYEPLEIIAKDFTSSINTKPELELILTNILNRPVKGKLEIKIRNLSLSFPKQIALKAYETKTIKVKVVAGDANADNTYPLEVNFDGGNDGIAVHWEDMHVNVIEKRTITVDGKLNDWEGVIPQLIKGSSKASITQTEAAWYPFKNFDENAEGLAQTYQAYDDKYFYFAAKVADKTPNKGTLRFEKRNDDDFFYPDTAYRETILAMQSVSVMRVADLSELGALQLPDKNGRVMNYLENTRTTQSLGIDLDLPAGKYTRTSLYFPNVNQYGVSVTVYDRESEKEILTTKIDKLWNGTYLSLDLSGKIRIRCSAYGWWYTAKLAGVFFDRTDKTSNEKTSALLVKTDFDTAGDWVGKYGKEGYSLVGVPTMLPKDISFNIVSKDDLEPLVWPKGVRHFTYRKIPTLPDGTTGEKTDNILIAFNVLPIGKDGMEAFYKGTMPRYIGYKCTDYEYALNTVAPEFSGDFEIWRMLVPKMPRKNFYPRQPKSAFDGPVKDGKLMTVRIGNTLYTECAIPWTEIPDVKKAVDKGEKIKFSVRINDDGAGGACMELARGRSVSKKNSQAFHPDWKEHWANEVEFKVKK